MSHLRNEQEYDRAELHLNELIDEVGDDENHPLSGLLDTFGVIIHDYEEQYHPMPECSGVEILRYLMGENDLKQTDLSEIGSQGVVSEILNSKRELNNRQIRLLSEWFKVSPAVFFK